MASIVSSFLYHSANKIEDFSRSGKKKTTVNRASTNDRNGLRTRLHQATLSTPIVNQQSYYLHTQASHSAESITPPPYDPAVMVMKYPNNTYHHNQQPDHQHTTSPILSPSISWSSDMSSSSSTYEKTLGNWSPDFSALLDRRSISQGMKLVSIAADEYDEGNETVALDIYLTGIDKILMALPNKTDAKTKLALREKLLSVEERVGILDLANQRAAKEPHLDNLAQSNLGQQQQNSGSSFVDAIIVSRITQTLQSVTQAAMRQTALQQNEIRQGDNVPCHTNANQIFGKPNNSSQFSHQDMANTVDRFKQFGQVLIQASVTLAIMIKQSPIPTLLAFCFHYFVHLLLWVDAHYGIRQRAQDLGVAGIKLLLQADEQYRLHEFLSEFLFMMVAATLKAVVAYQETPRYDPSCSTSSAPQNRQSPKLQDNDTNTIDDNDVQCLVPSSACASTSSYGISSWVWSTRR